MKPIPLFLTALFFARKLRRPGAGVLPGVIGTWKQVSSAPLTVTANRPLWDELGLQDSDHAVYLNGKTDRGRRCLAAGGFDCGHGCL